jgi:hypothetical protein
LFPLEPLGFLPYKEGMSDRAQRLLRPFLLGSLLLLAVSFCLFPLQSDDLFMYLALAKKYFELGSFPKTDIFLIHPQPWHMMHQWLSYFFFYGLFQAGGYRLISLTKVFLFLLTMLIPFFLWRRKGLLATATGGLALLLSCLAANFRFFERSEIFTDLFIVLVAVICLQEIKKPSRWLWSLPLIFLFWVNLHPGFPLGWALMAAAILCLLWQKSWRQARALSLCLLICVLVCLVNPLGLKGLLYPFDFSLSYAPFLKHYYFEWFSPLNEVLRQSPHLPFLLLLEFLTFFALLAASLLQAQSPPRLQWLIFLLSSYLLFTGVRFAPLGCFLLTTICLSLELPAPKASVQQLIAAAVAALCLIVSGKNVIFGYDTISGPRTVGLGVDERVVPVQAVEWMKTHGLSGPLYNSHMFGAYLAWAWDGKYVYDGSLTDPEYFLNEYVPFTRSREDFDRQTAKYHIQACLLDRFADAAPALHILLNHPGWRLVYKDEGSLIFARQ